MRDAGAAPPPRLVSVVDDDESVRESLPELLREFGFEARAFASAQAFLSSGALEGTDCLILDVTMPDMSGPELQAHVAHQRKIPIIFISASVDEAVSARVLAQGAVALLHKPFSDCELLGALRATLGPEGSHK